jgi:hypothetical protein
MTFDEVLPAVLRAVESWDHAASLRSIAVVRDLRGRIRLAVQFEREPEALLESLTARVQREVGPWFTGEVLCTGAGKAPLRNIAQRVLELAPEWVSARWRDDLGNERGATAGRWRLWERRVGKLPWLEGRVEPPWPLDPGAPTVVTFFSFKGGVGRTTTLASCALQAARKGERVAVIDLDLEAPGVGSLFGVNADRGVLDVLVEHLATGVADVASVRRPAAGLPDDLGDLIDVLPAGRLDVGYLEKLSRLDFSGSTSGVEEAQIPVREALLAMLQGVRDAFAPRWIFLDARAGLHDLAGLSLHGMAHLDVLFSRANAQGLAGLDVVLGALSRRQRDAASRTMLVHAMAPVSVTEATAERARMQGETHAMFVRHGLFAASDVPEVAADDGDHRPWTVQRVEAIERNDALPVILRELEGENFQRVWERIELLAKAGQESGEA